MLHSAMKLAPLFEAAQASVRTEEPATAVVVATGLILVFAILVLLYLLLLLEGKIFQTLDKKKKDRQQAESMPPAQVPSPAPAPAAPVAPVVEEGISPEVVAAIVAAVSASTGGAYQLRAVRTAKKGRGRWGVAGVIQSTEPF